MANIGGTEESLQGTKVSIGDTWSVTAKVMPPATTAIVYTRRVVGETETHYKLRGRKNDGPWVTYPPMERGVVEYFIRNADAINRGEIIPIGEGYHGE